jgi:serine protease SohB
LLAGLPAEPARVFVLKFAGDMVASKVDTFREEISAVLEVIDASRGDLVVVRLDSSGGTVSGYGLGASQLMRLKEARVPLTVCVDETACSGGYMMAAVADEIVAAPFAMLGSIGVIRFSPNVAERLTREGIAVDEVTAGKYKSTLSPFKPVTKDNKDAAQKELNRVFAHFKDHVKRFRPNINIEEVATGEVFLAVDAHKMGLCDRLGTADKVLQQMRICGADIYLGR